MSLSRTEEALLTALRNRGAAGAYGRDLWDICSKSRIYTVLGRLEERGLVRSDEQPPFDWSMPRMIWRITDAGGTALMNHWCACVPAKLRAA